MPIVAPYYYIWGYNNKDAYKTYSLMEYYKGTGGKCVTLAFIIGDIRNPSKMYIDIYELLDDIKAFQDVGGTIIISFGGANSPYLEDIMSEDEMYDTIEKMLLRTGCRAIDWDVEGGHLRKKDLNAKRAKVIVRLQKKFPNLYISFTLPVYPTYGLEGYTSMELLKDAVKDGVNINVVNGMAMDYYMHPSPAKWNDERLPPPGKTWGGIACEIGDMMVGQFKTLYPNKSTAELYRMVGLCPMIGTQDDYSIFTTNDFRIVSEYAKKNNIGLVTYWALNRDQVATERNKNYGLPVLSFQNKEDYEFYKAAISSGFMLESVPSAQPVQVIQAPPQGLPTSTPYIPQPTSAPYIPPPTPYIPLPTSAPYIPPPTPYIPLPTSAPYISPPPPQTQVQLPPPPPQPQVQLPPPVQIQPAPPKPQPTQTTQSQKDFTYQFNKFFENEINKIIAIVVLVLILLFSISMSFLIVSR